MEETLMEVAVLLVVEAAAAVADLFLKTIALLLVKCLPCL
jgi:hypothetical protein